METKLYEASKRGDVNSLEELLEEDSVLLHRVVNGFEYENPLGIAAMCGHVDFAVQILSRMPELATQPDQKGLCPLHFAARGNSISMVEVLVEANPEVCSLPDQDGRTPLHLAAMKNRTEIMRILIEKQPQAIQTLSEYQKETILHLCVKHNSLDALKLLVDKLRNQHINEDSVDLVSKDNKESISVNSKDGYGNTILHLAVARKNMKMIKYLLNSNIGVEQNAINNKGFTSMDILIMNEQRELRDLEIQDILREAGVLRSDASDQKREAPKDKCTIKKNYDKWLKENKNTLMVVSSLIATMAFQGALNPPGGVLQETKRLIESLQEPESINPTADLSPSPPPPDTYAYPGEPVMALEHPDVYISYMIFTSLGFFASMSVIFLLLSGFPFRRKIVGKFFMRLLIAVLWSAITFMTIAYLLALVSFTPEGQIGSYNWPVYKFHLKILGVALLAWVGLIGFIILVHIIRFIIWLLRKFRILKKRDGESRMDI
ncbi:hypothetical protein MKW92_040261 [Papaver armeniacum]|nr:hypothetical protein MKW92_040261 [Papaver armeniacum]